METIIKQIRQELLARSDEKIKKSSQHFFKENIVVYGIKASDVQSIGKSYLKLLKEFPKNEIFSLCELLWQSGYLEESIIACQLSFSMNKKSEPADFKIFESWIDKYVHNWASCDTLCNHTVGEFLEIYPEFLPELKKWAKSENRWMRRAASVSLIVPAKKGKFLKEIFELADILLQDADDLVQKGYGWMLKAASHAHQKEVFDYVMLNKAAMPRTALRYAIEKMPDELKKFAMQRI